MKQSGRESKPGAAATPAGDGSADPPARFDDILDSLRKLVDRLESGNLSLEDGLRCFEDGMQLCKKGAAILDSAEKRVEILIARPGSDKPDTAPFDAGSGERE